MSGKYTKRLLALICIVVMVCTCAVSSFASCNGVKVAYGKRAAVKLDHKPPVKYMVLKGKVSRLEAPVSVTSVYQAVYGLKIVGVKEVVKLTGNTTGMYEGLKVEAKGYFLKSTVPGKPLVFFVVSYVPVYNPPIPTPQITKIKGKLRVVYDPVLIRHSDSVNRSVYQSVYQNVYSSLYRFELVNNIENIKLVGETKGMENLGSAVLEVEGYYMKSAIPNDKQRAFHVITYKVLGMPVPVKPTIHTLQANPRYYGFTNDEVLGPRPNGNGAFLSEIDGVCIATWNEDGSNAFFNLKMTSYIDEYIASYEVQLVGLDTCDKESIKGTFNIKRNGVLLVQGIKGRAYEQQIMDQKYFMFTSDDTKWHISSPVFFYTTY